MCLAIRTAIRPDAPVAPFTSTVSPGRSRARSANAAQDAMPGLASAAADTSSNSSGNGSRCDAGTTVRFAIAPCGGAGSRK